MRIIGGKYSRRVIRPPRNLPVRPTTDLAKESLFNILNHKTDFAGKSALDLFAGTGAIAYELVSRGCSEVLAVEQNYACVQFIKTTSSDFGMDQLKVIRADVFRFLKTGSKKYDIIFADPPYDLENLEAIPALIFEKNMLSESGWLVLEHPHSVELSSEPYFVEHRKYGHVNFSFFRAGP